MNRHRREPTPRPCPPEGWRFVNVYFVPDAADDVGPVLLGVNTLKPGETDGQCRERIAEWHQEPPAKLKLEIIES